MMKERALGKDAFVTVTTWKVTDYQEDLKKKDLSQLYVIANAMMGLGNESF